jgi:hypothetical protein
VWVEGAGFSTATSEDLEGYTFTNKQKQSFSKK